MSPFDAITAKSVTWRDSMSSWARARAQAIPTSATGGSTRIRARQSARIVIRHSSCFGSVDVRHRLDDVEHVVVAVELVGACVVPGAGGIILHFEPLALLLAKHGDLTGIELDGDRSLGECLDRPSRVPAWQVHDREQDRGSLRQS